MLIANPIYDVVFKYMMKDNKVAKLLLSAIIGDEIEELEFKPTEVPVSITEAITVLRMDFKATVRYADGSRQVIIIELQKARVASDIIRFRRYLGEQYQAKENTAVVEVLGEDEGREEIRTAFPIVSIYFLGHKLPDLKAIPVVKVARHYTDLATGEILEAKSEFIECLTHDSYIIQIPYIKGHRRTELEQLLHIFDQTQVTIVDGKRHFLDVDIDNIPERYRSIFKRLLNAYANPEVKHQMYSEDELLGDLRFMGKKIKVLEKQKEVLEEEKEALEEEKETLALEKQRLQEKEVQQTASIRSGVLHLLGTGVSIAQVAVIFNISEAEVERIKQFS